MKVNIPKDSKWKEKRQLRWDDVWENSLRVIGISKQEKDIEDKVVAAQKKWYINGDLQPLMDMPDNSNKREALDVVMVMRLCPIVKVAEYEQFFQDYVFWASQHDLTFWGNYKNNRDISFFKSFFSLFSGEHTDSTEDIYAHMLRMLLPDENGVVTFPMKLGIDQWQPQQHVALCDCANDLLKRLGSYLFGAEGEYQGYSQLTVALPLIGYIKDLDPQYFDTVLLNAKAKRPPQPPTPRRVGGAGQELIRAVIGNIYGFKSYFDDYEGSLRHNDLEVELQLRELIESLSMPEEYHRLVEFIHAHPEDFVKHSD